MSESICILQHSGIGNTLHLTPMIQAIRLIKPNSRITLCTNPPSARIVEGWPVLDEISTENPKELLKRIGVVDWLILSPTGAKIDESMLPLARKLLQVRIRGGWTKHEVEVNMDFAREMGYEGAAPPSVAWVFPENNKNAEAILAEYSLKPKAFIAINPDLISKNHFYRYRHWGDANYRMLLERIKEELRIPCVILGTSHRKNAAEAIGDEGRLAVNLCGRSPDVKDAAALLSMAAFTIGNEGGLAHISAAVGTPTLTIFTVTNPLKVKPRVEGGYEVMVPCPYRLTCQHDQDPERCLSQGCLEVPFEHVWKTVLQMTTLHIATS